METLRLTIYLKKRIRPIKFEFCCDKEFDIYKLMQSNMIVKIGPVILNRDEIQYLIVE